MRRHLVGAARDVVDRVANRLAVRVADLVSDRVARVVADSVVDRFTGVLAERLRAEVDRAVRATHDVEFRARRDLLAAGERAAALAAAQFVEEFMPTGRTFHEPQATLAYALEIAPPQGMALEFGVFTGRSLELISAARAGVDVYGFDSFEGLPEVYRPHVRDGAFALESVPEVEGAELVVGWFDDTLPDFLAAHPGTVAFLHVDGDLYSSARTVLDLVGPRLVAGSVIVFDEFFNYPGWEQHEFRAWQEYLDRSGTTVSYEAYTSNNEQVVIRVLEPQRPTTSTTTADDQE